LSADRSIDRIDARTDLASLVIKSSEDVESKNVYSIFGAAAATNRRHPNFKVTWRIWTG